MSQSTGSRRNQFAVSVSAAAIALCAVLGCRSIAPIGPIARVPSPPGPEAAMPGGVAPVGTMLPNPLSMPVSDSEFFWNQLVDTVDDYFSIRAEQRVQQIGGVFTEGMIETRPRAGATVLEPWHWDSTPGFERIHSTLQSTRRRANVRVIPQGGTYSVEVVVDKVLEDVDRPSQGTPGSSVPRHDSSLLRLQTTATEQAPQTLGWIPLGRDVGLEQEILRELSARMFNPPGALQ